ncbi:MAG TPA: Spy/CpxP family protein refolding chaperone [Burkholderiales bacterium]|nr:Spy/CpxP family protein refolding chaperone [Burkholderiales bacterium]
MKAASKILVAVAVAAAVGSAFAAGPGWQGGRGPGAGYGPGSENCVMMGGAGPGAGYGPRMGGMGWGGRMGGGGGMMNLAAAEARLEGVKSALKITAEQESTWNAYAGVVKAQAETRAKFREQMAATDPAARAELQSQHFAANAEAAKSLATARDGLYSVLSAEQKVIADRVIGYPGIARRGAVAPGS